MKIATIPMPSNVRLSLACAALAVTTTLGIFSLVATLMPPLLADTQVLARTGAPEAVCAPVAAIRGANCRRPSAI